MESDLTQSAALYNLWAWADKNRKQLVWGLVVLVVIGIGIAFWFAHQSEEQNDANNALSMLTSRNLGTTAGAPTADDYLKVANEYSGTEAGQRALLLAATESFVAGKYDAAEGQFQKFLTQYTESPLRSQAAMGVASSLDAEGKTNEAISAYQGVAQRYMGQNVEPQAKLALARLLEGQGKFGDARNYLQDIVRAFPGSASSEAAARLQELDAAHPELQSTNAPAAVKAPTLVPTKP